MPEAFLQFYSIPLSLSAEEVVPLAQVGYGATLDELSDATRFKYFLRVVPPDRFQGQALADLIHHFGWPRVRLNEGNKVFMGNERIEYL